ncbi:MAG: hypothetical protein K2I16_06220 [Muribaculaceae bacterium]|nr:hypothetical protein [Muribaculaceae bacterium]
MKPLSTIALLLIIAFSAFSQTTSAPHPLYIANLLIDDISTERMAQTCKFHKLTESDPEDGFTVFTDAKGNKIRFKKTDNSDEGVNGKLIEVVTSDKVKTIDNIFKEIGYKKMDGAYERGSRQTNSLIRCTLFSNQNKTLSFLKIIN